MLAACFVNLVKHEEAISRHGSALARHQIMLAGARAAAGINGRLLPGLLDDLSVVNPWREGYLRERVRHRVALGISMVVAAVVGSLWSVVESVSDVLIAGIAHYAPVVAPVLLTGLLTLAVQTAVSGVPLTLGTLAVYLIQALWNSSLALVATLVIYGCWRYFQARDRQPENLVEGKEANGPKTTGTVG
jgi:hypothetical protein